MLATKSAVKAGSKDRGLLIGYARVPTQSQNLELQTEALQNAGCKKMFEDRVSGSRAERFGLAQAREPFGLEILLWSGSWIGWAEV